MAVFDFPTDSELVRVGQVKFQRLTDQRVVFRWFPVRDRDFEIVEWEQRDDFGGLQQLRGYNGMPPKVGWVGGKRFRETPGVYGEQKSIDELTLARRRQFGATKVRINIDDLVVEAQDHLLLRRLDRIELTLWLLAAFGTFSVAHPNGGIQHTGTYNVQVVDASDWTDHTLGTPLLDLRAPKITGRGKNVSFGSQAVAVMNEITANHLFSNQNDNDLYGRVKNLFVNGQLGSEAQANRVLSTEGTPQILIYDEGYLDDTNTYVPFIPDNRVVIFAKLPAGEVHGEYMMVRNVNNVDMAPGPYTKVIDRTDRVPREVEIHDGHNGGPALYWPGGIMILNVGP